MVPPSLRGFVRATASAAALVLVALAAPAPARAAAPDTARARDAYDRGMRAHAAGDDALAARAFAEADLIAPDAASLEAALESAMRADDVVLGAELLDRSASRAADAGLSRTVDAARKRFRGRVGKIAVDCGEAPSCLVSIDGVASDARRAFYAKVGPHAVAVQRGRDRFEHIVEVTADKTTHVQPESEPKPAPLTPPPFAPAAPAPARAEERGLSPVWFFVGVAGTAVAGGAAVLSGLDALKTHDRFATDCGASGVGPAPADCAGRADKGASAQRRTNILLGVGGALAIGTAALGIFAVRWTRASAEVRAGVASLALEVHTP